MSNKIKFHVILPVVDPGFPVRGAWTSDMDAFHQNVCKTKELGAVGGPTPGTPPRSANAYLMAS